MNRLLSISTAAVLAGLQVLPLSVRAENQMGYRLLPATEAAGLARGGGALGLQVGRAEQITDSGMTFELMRVNGVGQNSPGQRAGLARGDEIIAVDGLVFPSVAAFGSYVGSLPPGRQVSIDYVPSGGGPQEAQRIGVVLAGSAGRMADTDRSPTSASSGLSTGQKLAIGAGAAALFGCYKLGCLSRFRTPAR